MAMGEYEFEFIGRLQWWARVFPQAALDAFDCSLAFDVRHDHDARQLCEQEIYELLKIEQRFGYRNGAS